MKYFYLRFTEDDFTPDPDNGRVWRTDAVDLRNNTQYKNYSVHKSKYGLNLIGDNTWTGMNDYGNGQTSAGFVENDRFVDTTARVDVTKHFLNVSNYIGTELDYEVRFYSSDFLDDKFPELWNMKVVPKGRNIYRLDVHDYARFEIAWGDSVDTESLEFEYVVEVEIAETQVNALFERTRSVLDVFPEWMAIRKDSEEPEDPALATPNTVGGALINAVAGDTLEDIRSSLLYIKSQMFLTSANVDQKAWIYTLKGIPEFLYSVKGDGVELARTSSAKEFYESDDEQDVIYFLNFGNLLWVNKKYDVLEVNGYTKPPQGFNETNEEFENRPTYAEMLEATHVWNWFDEHGLLFDLKRLHLEDNDSFRKRILDVFINMPNFSLEGVKRSLRRELNLWLTYYGATPDSNSDGATPTIIEIEDIEQSPAYFDAKGLPTPQMEELVLWLSETYPSTWGFLRWGNALWSAGIEDQGYNVLPYKFDAEVSAEVLIDAGVGDMDDLYVFRPDEIDLTTTFDYQIKIKGRELTGIKNEWREALMPIIVSGRRDISYYTDRAKADITVWVTANGTTYWTNITLDSGFAEKSLTQITDRIEAEVSLLDQDNHLTRRFDWGVDGSDQIVYSLDNANENIEVNADDITDIAVSWGWDFDLSSVNPTNEPEPGYGYLVFAEDATPNTLPANADGTRLHADGPYSDIIRLIPEWDNSEMVVETEEVFTPQAPLIHMNGGTDNQKESAFYTVPEFFFSEFTVEGTEEVEVVIPEGRATSTNAAGDGVDIPNENISVNGNSAWGIDNEIVIPYDAENRTLEFATIDDPPNYPTEYEIWEPFTATSVETYQGVVDENGAWLGGIRPDVGQTNTRVQYHTLDRDDFGLPQTTDYVITWIGVELVFLEQADSVVVYLETNTVKPATFDSGLEYPDNSVVEAWDEDDQKYVFSEFYSHARRVQRANPEWNPFINSGWMYDRNDEYYLYAEKKEESFATPSFHLEKQPSLGAPIIIKTDDATPIEFRQVAFIENYATPALSDTNFEVVYGNGTTELYLSFEDVFDVTVTNLYTGKNVTLATETTSNVLEVSEVTDFDTEYEVSYKVNRSFTAEHNVINEDGYLTTEINIIEATPFGAYTVVYEGSEYNYATPIDIPLNPAYTLREEGFIFVCFDQFEYGFVQIKLSPGTIASTNEDYALVSLLSKDIHDNAKANQTFELSTDWGTLSEEVVTTDKDGFAFTILTGQEDTTRTYGTVTISKGGNPAGSIGFKIGQIAIPNYKLIALPAANSMPADGSSQNFIYGRVIAPDDLPVPYAVVSYRRGESVQDLFDDEDYVGQTVADSSGRFTIGPIVAATPNDPRTVFYALESWGVDDDSPATPGDVATPNYSMGIEYGPVGDVVYWREFPSITKALNEYNYLPTDTSNHDQQSSTFLSNTEAFPTGYDEATPTLDATPSPTLEWEVPQWYAINAYKQYQLGLRGDAYYEADYYYEGSHPDYKEF